MRNSVNDFLQVSELETRFFVLVTGANAGLGLSICRRLIDDFLTSYPDSHQLTIIFTTRSPRKARETFARLSLYLHDATQATKKRGTSAGVPGQRVTLKSETVDLTDLLSVRALSQRLVERFPKLDAIVLNAGIGGWTGLDWPRAIWQMSTDFVQAVTWPSYKLGTVGAVTARQTSLPDEPRLGAVFCANVFGHYMLAHNVVPLLRRSGQPAGPGRIIWVSSLDATGNVLDPEDLQGLRSSTPYESSKRLTDILALTAKLPSTAPWVNSFLSTMTDYGSDSIATTTEIQQQEEGEELQPRKSQGTPLPPSEKPNVYLCHPGICGTGIIALPFPLFYCMLAAMWIVRLIGSPWHVVMAYIGACAPVWLALSRQHQLDEAEAPYLRHGGFGSAKWGSSCNRLGGSVCVANTEVEGWGYGGVVGRPVLNADRRRWRKRGAIDLTVEGREQFEEVGRRCWGEMEALRVKWDRILDQAEETIDS